MSDVKLSSIEEIIAEARNGRMFILVDDEDRENEGDLIIPGQMATPDAINFMARYGRGLICLAMTSERVEQLGLPLMSPNNGTRHETAFTVSIEAKDGVTTGISAADRARTIQVAIDPSTRPGDIVTPGHVFPLRARPGGVLVRAGHTEAAVDISRLAGLNPSGVICEVMRDDGTMARLPDLVEFARQHDLKLGTIRDLIAYRLRHDSLVKAVAERPFRSEFGGNWTARVYRSIANGVEHLALIKGKIDGSQPTLVRMHTLNLFDDILAERTDRAGMLVRSMKAIGDEGNGVVVIIRGAQDPSFKDMLGSRMPGEQGQAVQDLREYGVGAQILLDLGVRHMVLLSNSNHHLIGLEGYGLDVVEERRIPPLVAARSKLRSV